MIFEEIHLDSWGEFDNYVAKMDTREWVFRGHSDSSWKLESSLYRLFNDIQPIIEEFKGTREKFAKDAHEKLLIEQFQAHAHLYLNVLPDKNNKLEWLSIMQHFGAPTRMLDFTFSPHIASYFSMESGHGEFAIYALNHKKYTYQNEMVLEDVKDFTKEIFDNRKSAESYLIAYESRMSNERLVAQQGLFIVPSTNYQTLEDILDYYELEEDRCKKFILSGSLRYEGIQRLKRMNITSATLFPGIDGFCRSLKFQILSNPKTLAKLG